MPIKGPSDRGSSTLGLRALPIGLPVRCVLEFGKSSGGVTPWGQTFSEVGVDSTRRSDTGGMLKGRRPYLQSRCDKSHMLSDSDRSSVDRFYGRQEGRKHSIAKGRTCVENR